MAKTATTTKTATKTAGRAKALRPADSSKAAMAKLQRELKAARDVGDTKLGYRIYYQIRKLRGAVDNKGAAPQPATQPAPQPPAAVAVPVVPFMPATQLVAVRTPPVGTADVTSALKVLIATHAQKAKGHDYDNGYADGLREALAMLGIATK